MVIKENQRETRETIAEIFRDPPGLPYKQNSEYRTHSSSGKGYGRYETRVVEPSNALNEWVRWPGVGQVKRRTCKRVSLKTGEVEEETNYAITSLSHDEASAASLGGTGVGSGR